MSKATIPTEPTPVTGMMARVEHLAGELRAEREEQAAEGDEQHRPWAGLVAGAPGQQKCNKDVWEPDG